ncbi:MAG: 2-C-methyl-D-erythritol 4-phosphate cytidylyltransferase [Clostridia bacterium]|nr:2-C-methyl-D-erythritol 4-phosphate cytidylyltransferase [Clostridia bacterium]
MIENKEVTGIILIAGNSIRYGQNKNKNFEKIKSKYIFQYSLEAFQENIYIDNIILAIKGDEKEYINNIIKKMPIYKEVKLVQGGKSRKESVYNCISKTDSDIVIIHDGARPLIKQEYINKNIEAMKKYKGTSIAVKSKDTIKITNNEGIVIKTTERKNTWLIQTPQCFNRIILKKAHENCKEQDKITDDCMLLEKEGYEIKLIDGDYSNIKLTNLEDLKIIEKFF